MKMVKQNTSKNKKIYVILLFIPLGVLPDDSLLKFASTDSAILNIAHRSKDRPQPSCSLQHEFSLLNTNIPHIDVDALDPIKRTATVRIFANGHVIMLQVLFPIDYPNLDKLPEFSYCKGTSIDEELSDSLMKVLKTCAYQRAKKGRTCLEQCLRALVNALKKVCKDLIYAMNCIFFFFCRELVGEIKLT